ncbi:MAG: sigma-54-dependent Fis family transcriptional regulator [Verrucomicrobia bacterium]|nr:sigma-54-dependent Fis family transcriptional regulator [Verrucomicrobiota bacterium]
MGFTKILVQESQRLLVRFLEDKKLDTTWAKNRQMAIELLEQSPYEIIFCEEIEVLERAKQLYPKAFVIVVTPFASVEQAVQAMRLGAFDYLTQPVTSELLDQVLERAEESFFRSHVMHGQSGGKIEQIMAESSVMKHIVRDIAKVSQSDASVFICGESGTGKEVIAHAIHTQSPRALKPYIKVNCAAIPETLIESEFFGHEKGSFTGAHERKLGRFELASHGTLLLDEVSEIPLSLQAKLLRAIQEREFERVGGTKTIEVDVRLIATSNRNMKEMVEQKLFREDLYYRLNVVPIELPPLRERKEDILTLAQYFLERLCEENHKKHKTLSPAAQQHLLSYRFPGNIRELINILERTVVMDASDCIEPEHLRLDSCPIVKAQPQSLVDIEKKHILSTLESLEQDEKAAAKVLGITLRALRSKLATYRV